MEELLERMRAEIELTEEHVQTPKRGVYGENKTIASSLHTDSERKMRCAYCNDSHPSENCQAIQDAKTRKTLLVKHARCFKCLKKNHTAFSGRSQDNCKGCGGHHHVSICNKNSSGETPRFKQPNLVQEHNLLKEGEQSALNVVSRSNNYGD